MIFINGYQIDVKHFPDGTQCLMDCDSVVYTSIPSVWKYIQVGWRYESDEELVTLIYLVNHIRQYRKDVELCLFMPYIPNARMDRVKSNTEVFTLKYFCNIINSLNFDKVFVLDPHSDVSVALLNNVEIFTPDDYIAKVIQTIKDNNHIEGDEELMIYFPDAGAYKRYKDMECLNPYEKIYGQKVRDWKTGKIKGLEIVDKDGNKIEQSFEDVCILMIDDIISFGGTMYYSALKLYEFKPYRIYAYATHVEPKSLWNEEKGTFKAALQDGIVKTLYTTDSIYNLESNDFVNVMEFRKAI